DRSESLVAPRCPGPRLPGGAWCTPQPRVADRRATVAWARGLDFQSALLFSLRVAAPAGSHGAAANLSSGISAPVTNSMCLQRKGGTGPLQKARTLMQLFPALMTKRRGGRAKVVTRARPAGMVCRTTR